MTPEVLSSACLPFIEPVVCGCSGVLGTQDTRIKPISRAGTLSAGGAGIPGGKRTLGGHAGQGPIL